MKEMEEKRRVEIEFVNHASFIIRLGRVALMSDPWFHGTAFNDGWSLLVEERTHFSVFETITHLWISHEHPDHFSVPTLLGIPPEQRARLTLLFQRTRDGRVARWCRDNGFRVIELAAGRPYGLGEDVTVTCVPHGHIDSWLLCEAGGSKILNLNDCNIRTYGEACYVRRYTGRVDVLFTQFGFANRVGNAEDDALRREESRRQLGYLQAQADALKPRYLVPFASFIRFSHEENRFMNEGNNGIAAVCEFVRSATSATPVVMYPGDRWSIGSPWDNEEKIRRYEAAARVPIELRRAPAVELDEIRRLGEKFVERLKKRNWGIALRTLAHTGFCRTSVIYLQDQDRVVAFDLVKGLREGGFDREDAEIEMASDSLAFALKHEWGAETLYVNARYQARRGEDWRFLRHFYISILNNAGYRFPLGVAAFLLRDRLAWRLWRAVALVPGLKPRKKAGKHHFSRRRLIG